MAAVFEIAVRKAILVIFTPNDVPINTMC
jgi:hypothetical protein